MTSLQFVGVHLAVADADAHAGQQFAQPGGDEIDGLDTVVEVEHLPAPPQLEVHGVDHGLLVVGLDDGLDGVAVRRRRLDHAEVARAGERHVERAGNGRGAHREHVDGGRACA
jgi:hypothetical protein